MKMKDFDISMTQYNRGDIITGTIVMIGETEVVVALGGLKEGVFPKTELDKAFKIGDAILVLVTGEIDDKGCLVVKHEGVNEALDNKEKLKNLKVGSELEFKATNVTPAGIVGDYMGYRVFLPYSQCSTKDYMEKDQSNNKTFIAIVTELDNIKKSIVCSTKLLEKNNCTQVEIGETIPGVVIKLEDKYALVMLDNGIKAKLSIKDASYTHVNTLSEVVKLDEKYDFKILDTNTDYSRIDVGLKQLKENPLDEVFNSLHIGDEVEGVVAKIYPSGAVIKLDNGLSSFAVTKDNTDKANVATHYIYKLGARVKGYISQIDAENHKINIITNIKAEQN